MTSATQEVGMFHLMMTNSDLSTALDIKTEAERDTSLVVVIGMKTFSTEAGRGTGLARVIVTTVTIKIGSATRPILATVLTTAREVESASGIGTHLGQQATKNGKIATGAATGTPSILDVKTKTSTTGETIT